MEVETLKGVSVTMAASTCRGGVRTGSVSCQKFGNRLGVIGWKSCGRVEDGSKDLQKPPERFGS